MPRPDSAAFDDGELVVRARDGAPGAFEELVRRHQRSAHRVAAVVSGSIEEANDIVQDAFITIHGSLATYRATGSARSWMLRIVANTAKNHRRASRRRRRRNDRYARLDPATGPSIDEAVMGRIEHQQLSDALARLRESDRLVLAYRYLAELSEAETADALGVRRGTVKSRTSRALARLRRELPDEGTTP